MVLLVASVVLFALDASDAAADVVDRQRVVVAVAVGVVVDVAKVQ